MRTSQTRMEAITTNLSNLSTPGYKKVGTSVRAFQVPGQPVGANELVTRVQVDFVQGNLQASSNPYHLGLQGPGFFAVEGLDGELYTRRGTFRVDDQGVLQTDEGFPIAWQGRGGKIDAVGAPVTIDGSGVVRQGNNNIGTLRIVDFDRPDKLEQIGGGYFQATPETRETPTEAVIYQSTLETSNVAGVEELVNMINVQRSFESATQMMKMVDESYKRLNQAR
ncbi:MAG: flagellar hook basal-body protein [Planctomycetes bacterium]|nr:flagellar hook basal-body protein [Planctomycetota bacterium]MCB9905081.1 flagellar hook basal-body protein [Planctomycetota bacterium]